MHVDAHERSNQLWVAESISSCCRMAAESAPPFDERRELSRVFAGDEILDRQRRQAECRAGSALAERVECGSGDDGQEDGDAAKEVRAVSGVRADRSLSSCGGRLRTREEGVEQQPECRERLRAVLDRESEEHDAPIPDRRLEDGSTAGD